MNTIASIIVPVYNTEFFLAETLQSAINQTYQNIEIIVIDDASTDASRAIIQNFQKQHPEKIRTIFHAKNTGEAIARKDGIMLSQGDWIYLLDSDDIMYPDAIERLMNCALKTNTKVILGHRDRINAKSEKIKKDTSIRWEEGIIHNISGIFTTRNPLTPGNLLISRDILELSDFETSIRYGEDWFLFAKLSLQSEFYCIGGHPVYSYRYHSRQQSRSKIPFSERKKVIEAIYDIPDLQKKYNKIIFRFRNIIAITRLWLWHNWKKYR